MLALLEGLSPPVESMPEEAIGFVSMIFCGNRFDMPMSVNSDLEAHSKSNGYQGEEFTQPVPIGQVGVFEVKSSFFDRLEKDLDTPSFSIDPDGAIGKSIGHDDEVFFLCFSSGQLFDCH